MSVTASGAIFLFFSGVIAFVPERPNSNRVEAFLLNVKEPKHVQYLAIPLDNFTKRECPVSADGKYKCEKDGNTCVCPLEGVSISIPGQKPFNRTLPDKPPSTLPLLNGSNTGDIAWLVSMSYIKPSQSRVVRSNVDSSVGGRISFNWVDAATCRFEEAPCKVMNEVKRRIFAVKFPVAIAGNREQAVAELVVFKTEIEVAEVSVGLKRDNIPLVSLDLNCPAGTGCPILIVNSMKGSDDSYTLCDQCGESQADGEHVREYRRLVNDANGVAPHRLCGAGEYVDLANTLPELCEPVMAEADLKRWVKSVSNRVICPSVSLVP